MEKIFKTILLVVIIKLLLHLGHLFEQIANKRTIGEIQGQIISPKSMYQQLGYKDQ